MRPPAATAAGSMTAANRRHLVRPCTKLPFESFTGGPPRKGPPGSPSARPSAEAGKAPWTTGGSVVSRMFPPGDIGHKPSCYSPVTVTWLHDRRIVTQSSHRADERRDGRDIWRQTSEIAITVRQEGQPITS